MTTSQNLATSNAFQAQVSESSNEAFIAKLDAGGATVLYASYHGGSGQDTATAVAVDRTGSVWIAGATGEGGGTEWAKYPTRNPIQAEHAGVFDAFLAKIAER